MKSIMKLIGILILIFFGITGYFLEKREYIPDNAIIYVFPDHKLWLPKANFVDEILEYQSELPELKGNMSKLLSDKEESIYEYVKNGKYSDFQLPETWLENKDRIYWGSHQSILRYWIAPKKERWNNDGSWNW